MTLRTYSLTESGTRSGAVFCFSIRGDADPGLMPRLMELWAKRGLVPDRWYGARSGIDDGFIEVDIEVAGMEPRVAAQIAVAMRATFGVAQVLVSEKRSAVRA